MKKVNVLSIVMLATVSLVACKKNEKIEEVNGQETVITEPEATIDSEVADDTSVMEEISTTHFEGDGINLSATFLNDKEGNMAVRLVVGENIYELPQTEAWAKGAIYKKDNVEFENKGQINEAELKIDGKVYKLKQAK